MLPGFGFIQGKVATVSVVSVWPKPSIRLDTGELLESIEDRRVEGFAGNGAIFQRREVVFGQIFTDEEAEDSRRSTQRCDMIVVQLLGGYRRE
jgi:hypothetical protein